MEKIKKGYYTTIILAIYLISTIPISIESVNDSETEELNLLRVEHHLMLYAKNDTDIFCVKYAFPPDYNYQVPIFLEILKDTDENITGYTIEDDKNSLNKFVNFTVKEMKKDEKRLIQFTIWVLVKNHDFSDLPTFEKIPKKCDIPKENHIWLDPSPVVQSDSIIIKIKSMQLKGLNNNIMKYTSTIASFIKNHRFLLFLMQYNFGFFFSQDAITTLFLNAENVGRSHLACALLRSQNIPSRIILVNNDQGFWTQMHYMVEYYLIDYGWVLIETTEGVTPYETKKQVINHICYPINEHDTKTDYIFPTMKGEEKWIWIDNSEVIPYYTNCKQNSKSQMFSEQVVNVQTPICNCILFLTQNVFSLYQKILKLDHAEVNQSIFSQALYYQKKAIEEMKETGDIQSYISMMECAYVEYDKIEG